MCAPVIECEAERLEALYQYQILDTAPESAFDDLTQLAAHICNAPIALISLVDRNRQWFKSKVGLTVSETHRDLAFCAHAILKSDPFIVENATLDQRFFTNPLVTGEPHIRFYAGFPLVTPTGYRIGTLCVIDRFPRQFSPEQIKMLRILSRQIVNQLELRRSYANLESVFDRELNVTKRKQLEEMLQQQLERERYQASHDQLTELPNRLLFDERLTLALNHAEQPGEMLAVMFLDLDRFKSINDTLGHAIGDQLLQQAAQRIAGCLKQGDTLARWGGDEFTLILSQLYSPEDISEIAQRILKVLEAPFKFEQQELHITASIGIALAPYDGEDAGTLLKNADTAMYRAKQQGRNSFQLYTNDMNMWAFDQLVLINDLYNALDRNEFLLHYQPQVNLQTGEIVAIEALIRWQHPQRGLVPPDQFIAIAEETGQINAIGEWVLRTACAQNRAWQMAGLSPIRVAVNLSGRQFRRSLPRLIAQVLSDTGLDPQYLEIEITESIAMQDLSLTIAVLKELQKMGVCISIDDFGTGYSSLAMLKQFPLHTLKIAREFIKDLDTNPQDAAVIEAIMTLGHGLSLGVVAEGVETQEQWNFLRSINCDAMQGYFFSRPVAAEVVMQVVFNKLSNH